MKFSHSLMAAAALCALAALPAHALTVNGVSYALSESLLDAHDAQFTLTITGINSVGDSEGGRSGVNSLAFYKPAHFVSATMTSPAGWTTQSGGLNSSGCDGSGAAWFCFDNPSIPPTPSTAYAANSTLTFVFTETISSGSFTGYATDLKIDWVGSQRNYDLVSKPIDICTQDCGVVPSVPEPESYALMLAGLGTLGFLARRRRQG